MSSSELSPSECLRRNNKYCPQTTHHIVKTLLSKISTAIINLINKISWYRGLKYIQPRPGNSIFIYQKIKKQNTIWPHTYLINLQPFLEMIAANIFFKILFSLFTNFLIIITFWSTYFTKYICKKELCLSVASQKMQCLFLVTRLPAPRNMFFLTHELIRYWSVCYVRSTDECLYDECTFLVHY